MSQSGMLTLLLRQVASTLLSCKRVVRLSSSLPSRCLSSFYSGALDWSAEPAAGNTDWSAEPATTGAGGWGADAPQASTGWD